METEDKVTIQFVVPKPTDPGAPKRRMAFMAMGRRMQKLQKIVSDTNATTDEKFDAMDEILNEQYRYYASFVVGCTQEKALEYIMDCSEEQIAQMEDALAALNDPKGTKESQKTSEGTLDTP